MSLTDVKVTQLETKRLRLRQWVLSDGAPLYQLNSDPEVMAFFPNPLSKEQSDTYLLELHNRIAQNGYGFWAVEEKASGGLVGFVGLNVPKYDLPFGPCTEIGWRLAKPFWGKGYATEAAEACLEYGFIELKTDQIYSFTANVNRPSEKVMIRLGMTKLNNTFKHPFVSQTSHLSEHILYCMTKLNWENKRKQSMK